MIGALIIVAGIALGVMGWMLLRRSGSGWRIGRLLSAAPQRSLREAREMASEPDPGYIRVHGRVDSDEEFPGDNDVPVVFRRRRLQRGHGRSEWTTFDDERLAVPFRLSDRGERVSIDVDALGDGLVVVPRISDGVASELPDDAGSEPLPSLAPDTPVRLRIEQVSTVDHATAAGVPRLGIDGDVVLGPGMGRPLVLTILDPDEAMRVLASDRRTSLLLASGLLAGAPILIFIGLVAVFLLP
jgi:hypothetical protein